ncbi:MAG: Mur ligase family protein, partial [Bacteroidota bacterium]|nr:Mur ligase family protein [Bacteroidota bacterium]
MPYTIKDICTIISDDAVIADPAIIIDHLLVDSRRVVFPAATLFFALSSSRRSGAAFIEELYKRGVKCFVVTRGFYDEKFGGANFLFVDDPLKALQKLAAFHRKQFEIPIIGITGSNGKTIVKEWLYQLLHTDYNIVRSPKSYNSQIGVALSVWQINGANTLAIFEAGISEVGEMDFLENMIKPTIGILTNVGAAHSAGFESKEQKVREKLKLFKNAYTIVSNNQDTIVNIVVASIAKDKLFIWGDGHADVRINEITKSANQSKITAIYNGRNISISIPFTDNASIENAISCWSLLLYLSVVDTVIARRMQQLQSVEMRLQLKKGINNCSIINDAYSNDLSSLRMALDFLHQQAGNQSTTVVLSDLGETSISDEQYHKVLQALVQHQVDKFIGIGPRLFALQLLFQDAITNSFFYNSVHD